MPACDCDGEAARSARLNFHPLMPLIWQTFDKSIVALYNAEQCRTTPQFPAKPSQRGNTTIFGENLTTPEQDHQISPGRRLIARSFDLSKYLYYPLDHHTTYWPWSLSHHPTKANLILVNNAKTPKNT
ncbi:hypothetical protein B0H16DRAFT_1473426 [Mycena metata]|uniref:Uncharacterized protein n=1 Tax=Mycena metata TaxID=1033252 RepID=A0AAD7HJR7_9AGAR|nr:hypothetical protein B0H16DRAFT_1473426 [Mycena metata]